MIIQRQSGLQIADADLIDTAVRSKMRGDMFDREAQKSAGAGDLKEAANLSAAAERCFASFRSTMTILRATPAVRSSKKVKQAAAENAKLIGGDGWGEVISQ
ncbi:hypothetical protein [Ruegeria arenilitoris]|uniref:hypothetical protein n=1 Tax=Ruegeria arenilitoris TaxID=1173585 RepID=UPI001480419E|nr:hypothetical protein [Ruegeria arenilitoris]